MQFDLFEQCRGFLNLVNKYGRRIVLEESSAFFFGACADNWIVQCDIFDTGSDFFKHCSFAYLTRSCDEYGAEHF